MSDMLIVKSRVQEYIRDQGCSPTENALDELNEALKDKIEEATNRTEGNGRKRVKRVDI